MAQGGVESAESVWRFPEPDKTERTQRLLLVRPINSGPMCIAGILKKV
jgi:hypothetical protein